jgi:hypothetical protein
LVVAIVTTYVFGVGNGRDINGIDVVSIAQAATIRGGGAVADLDLVVRCGRGCLRGSHTRAQEDNPGDDQHG